MTETPEFKEAVRQAEERRRAYETPERHQQMMVLKEASIRRAINDLNTAIKDGTLMTVTMGPDGKRIRTPVNPKAGQVGVDD